MRQVARIARTELSCLFHSPIAWFILVMFWGICLKDFFTVWHGMAADVSLLPEGVPYSLTVAVFAEGVCSKMVGTLFIYIPLLTMGLMARETSSGSIKLLESSPIRPLQIILGKYLAAITVGAMMLLVPAGIAVFLGCRIVCFDVALALSCLLGIYLLIAAYCAIGLFMSTTTSYQMVAALLSLLTLGALNYVGQLWQEWDFVRSVTYWLAIPGRTANFINGLIRIDDIAYFILLSAMFLGFATVLLSNRRHSWSVLRKGAGYLVVATVVMLAAYASTTPCLAKQWDVTDNKVNSLTSQTMEVLGSLDGPVRITEYVNLIDNASYAHLPANRKIASATIDRFALYKRDLSFHSKYYYKQNSQFTHKYFQDKTEEQLRDIFCMTFHTSPRLYRKAEEMDRQDLLAQRNWTWFALVEGPGGKEAILHDYADMERFAGEEELTTVLRSLIAEPDKIAFICSEGERPVVGASEKSMDSYTVDESSRYSLINKGFEVYQADLNCGEVPEDIDIAVLADPSLPFSCEARKNLDLYLKRGGNMLILLDRASSERLSPILGYLGLKASEGISAMEWEEFEPTLVVSRTAKGNLVTMNGATSLEITDSSSYKASVLLETIKPVAQADRNSIRSGAIDFSNAKAAVTAYALENRSNPSQRIIIVSDADCMSNAELSIYRDGIESNNYAFIMDCFRYLSASGYPIEIPVKKASDNKIRENRNSEIRENGDSKIHGSSDNETKEDGQ